MKAVIFSSNSPNSKLFTEFKNLILKILFNRIDHPIGAACLFGMFSTISSPSKKPNNLASTTAFGRLFLYIIELTVRTFFCVAKSFPRVPLLFKGGELILAIM